jgi:signal transduction histidine kinase
MDEGYKILIIDDSQDDRELCKRALQGTKKNLKIFEAGDAKKAYEFIDQISLDCVLLDYSLPGKNGIEVLKTIRKNHRFLPIVMLTGQGNEIIAVQSMKGGAQDYAVKSTINSESLYHLVETAIEVCKMQQHIENQEEALALFTRALAHDLKEPLRTIQYLTNLVKEGPLNWEQRHQLNRVSNTAVNMEKLIHTVRSYTELADETNENFSSVVIKDVIESALVNLAEPLQNARTQVSMVGEFPSIQGNESQLAEIFQNLLINAIHHANSNQLSIEIGVTEKADDFEFFVKDNGQGIEKRYWNLKELQQEKVAVV